MQLIKFIPFFVFFTLSELVTAAPDGKKLFADNCSGCHGEVGLGGIGLTISKKKLATELSDEYLKRTIRLGRPGRVMPAFETMSDAQVDAIVIYMRSWVNISPKLTAFTQIGNTDEGEKLFVESCLHCHKHQGTGGQGTGITSSREREHAVMPPAISNVGFLSSASDELIAHVIVNGRLESKMPAFKNFKSEEIANLIAYLRSVRQKREQRKESTEPLQTIMIESPYDFSETVENLKQTIRGRNFRVFPDLELEYGLFSEEEIDRKQMTIRACNFKLLYDMLNIEPRLGIVLPCTITVVEDDQGKVTIIAANLKYIAKLFNNDLLVEMFDEMHQIQLDLLDEATF